MILLKDVIDAGNWFHCEYKRGNQSYQFRLRILSFQKLDLTQVDEPEKISLEKETTIWLMEAEMINLTKEPISSGVIGYMDLKNQKGMKYHMSFDSHLLAFSEFGKMKRLNRFNTQLLIPKIKAVGAIILRLPVNDDNAEYSISIRNGSICEV